MFSQRFRSCGDLEFQYLVKFTLLLVMGRNRKNYLYDYLVPGAFVRI